MKLTRAICCSLVFLAASCSLACCPWMRELNEPKRPSTLRGWGEFHLGDTIIKGDFVLNKGESTDNGNIGIKIVEIYAGKCQLFDEPIYPQVKVQFYKVSDKS